MAKKKYYVVKQGHQRGIFDCWEDCQRNVLNYRGAIYKGFATIEEARAWYAEDGAAPTSQSGGGRGPPAAAVAMGRALSGGPCYAVKRGHRTGIFGSWADCQAAVTWFSGAEYKKFDSYEEAVAFLQGTPAAIPPAVQQMRDRPPGEQQP